MIYEESFRVECPECREMIQVGRAGPLGITQHQGKKKCQATKKGKAAEVAAGRQPTLFSLGFSRANRQPQSRHANEASVSSHVGNWLGTSQASIITVDLNENVPPPHPCCPDAAGLLTKLRGAAKRLTSDDEVSSNTKNELADFIGHPTCLVSLDTPIDDVWELADPILNRALGFGRSQVELQALVQQNHIGTTGLCNFIEYLLVEKHVSPGLLEGKVERLVGAINER